VSIRARAVVRLLIWLAAVAASSAAYAQTRPPAGQTRPPQPAPRKPPKPPYRGPLVPKAMVTVGVAGDATTLDFSQAIHFDAYAETAEIAGPVDLGHGVHPGVTLGFRVWHRIGLAFDVSGSTKTGSLDANYSLPYPFAFNQPRTTSGSAPARRTTVDLDIRALLLVHDKGKKWSMFLYGGPSISTVNQQFAPDRFAYSYVYPFDTVDLTPLDSKSGAKGHGFGGNAGVLIERRLSKRADLEGLIGGRFVRAKFSPLDSDQHVQVGGARLGIGLRFRFGK
jgi:hypothetical protein